MLDELLEALSEMVEPVDDGESSHRSPERETLAVEPLEERIALTADVAAVAEAPAADNPGPVPTEAAPTAATASLLPPPAIPANLIAEVQSESKAGHSPQETSPAMENLGELQHEFALEIHESETPGTLRDGRIGSQHVEPGERADEQAEGAEHAEHSETHESEEGKEEQGTPDEGVGALLSAEEKCAAEVGNEETSPTGGATSSDQHIVEQAAVRGQEPLERLAIENNLGLATGIESGLDRQAHEVASEDVDREAIAERSQPPTVKTTPSTEPEPGGVLLKAAAIGVNQLDKGDAPPDRLFDGGKPPSAEEMLSAEVKAHDACFSAPIEHPAALAALPEANTPPAPRQQP